VLGGSPESLVLKFDRIAEYGRSAHGERRGDSVLGEYRALSVLVCVELVQLFAVLLARPSFMAGWHEPAVDHASRKKGRWAGGF